MKKRLFLIAFVSVALISFIKDVVPQTTITAIVLNEIVIAPPGIDAASGCEYVEFRGLPNTVIGNFTYLDIEGDFEQNPGTINYIRSLQNLTTGNNGLLVIAGSTSCREFDSETSVLLDPEFQSNYSISNNGTNSFIIYSGQLPYLRGQDLDANNDGAEDNGASWFDGIAVFDGNNNSTDVIYGLATLNRRPGTPANEAVNAATRFCRNSTRNSAAAFYYGDLESTPNTVNYSTRVNSRSLNFPHEGQLTPGGKNAPCLPPPNPVISGQIVDRNGRGISKAYLTIIGSGGETKTAISNPFGFFRFENILRGSVCTISLRHKKYKISDQTVNVLKSDVSLIILAER